MVVERAVVMYYKLAVRSTVLGILLPPTVTTN